MLLLTFLKVLSSLNIFKMKYSPSTFPPKCQWPKKMPPQIAYFVFTTVPTADGICFALTCKFLHAFYLFLLKRRGRTTIPVTPQSMFIGVKTLPWHRIDLLRRLQSPDGNIAINAGCSIHALFGSLSGGWTIRCALMAATRLVAGSAICRTPVKSMCPCHILNIHHKL